MTSLSSLPEGTRVVINKAEWTDTSPCSGGLIAGNIVTVTDGVPDVDGDIRVSKNIDDDPSGWFIGRANVTPVASITLPDPEPAVEAPYVGTDGATHIVTSVAGFWHGYPIGSRVRLDHVRDSGLLRFYGPSKQAGPFALGQTVKPEQVRPITPEDDAPVTSMALTAELERLRAEVARVEEARDRLARETAEREAAEAKAAQAAKDDALAERIYTAFYASYRHSPTPWRVQDDTVKAGWLAAAVGARRAVLAEQRDN